MTRRNPRFAFEDMLDYAREAYELVQGKTLDDLRQDRVLELALLRLLEVVGEAATRVPDELQLRYDGIPWRQVVGLRNRLIHGYDAVDLVVVWDVLVNSLPSLIAEPERVLINDV
jgi:uncharacterized protein with HEPN domain